MRGLDRVDHPAEVSRVPQYSGAVGRAWLERGGVYVLANIRGGGEFGPKWHEAAMQEKHQTNFDDFIAVAEDLIERRITSPEHLGIMGKVCAAQPCPRALLQ